MPNQNCMKIISLFSGLIGSTTNLFMKTPNDMRKYGHCNSLDFYKKSILNHFTWPSTDGNIWRHLDEYSVIKKKGMDLVDFVSISPSDKDEYEAVGYLNPSPRSRSDYEISPIGIKFKVFLYSVDFGIEKNDPNRGLWIQGKEDGAWYRLCKPSEEYRTIHELNALKTKTFLDLYDFIRSNEEDFNDVSDEEYLYCNLTIDQFIAKLKSKDFNTSFLQEFRAFYYRNFDTTFSPNCPFMKSFKSYVDNSSLNLLNPAINISDNSLSNTSNRKRKYIVDDDDDEVIENPLNISSDTSIVDSINEEMTVADYSDHTPCNNNIIADDCEVIDQVSSLSSTSTLPTTNLIIENTTATKTVNIDDNNKDKPNTSKNKKIEVSTKKRGKPAMTKESSSSSEVKKSVPSNKRGNNSSSTSIGHLNDKSEDNNILLNYQIGSRVYAKEEKARHFNFGVIVGESEDKKHFKVKWDINAQISEIPKLPSCFEEFENKRKSKQTEKFVPNFMPDKGNRTMKDPTPVIVIDDDDDEEDDNNNESNERVAEVKSKKTSKNEKIRETKLSSISTSTGKGRSRKRPMLSTTKKKERTKKKKKPRRRKSTDTVAEDSEDDFIDSSDDDSIVDEDDDDDDDEDANYEEGMEEVENEPEDVPEKEVIREDNHINIHKVHPDLPIPANTRRSSDSALLPSSTTLKLSKPLKQRHHSDSVEQPANDMRIHSISNSRKGIQDEFNAILNKQREKGELNFTNSIATNAVLTSPRAGPSPRSTEPVDALSGSSSNINNIRNSTDFSPKALPKKPLNIASTTSLIETVNKSINISSSNLKIMEGKSDKEVSKVVDSRSVMTGNKSSSSIRPDWSIALDQKKKERLAVTSDRISRQDIPPNMIPVGIRDDYSTITRTMPMGPMTSSTSSSSSSSLTTRVNEMRDLSKASNLIATADSKTRMRNSSSNITGNNIRSGERKEQKDRPHSTLLTSTISTLDRIKKKGILLTPSSTNSTSNFSSFNSATVPLEIPSGESGDNIALDQLNDEDDAPRKSKGVRFADDNGGYLSTLSTYDASSSNDSNIVDSHLPGASTSIIPRSTSLDNEVNYHASTALNSSDDNKSSLNRNPNSNLLQAKEIANARISNLDSKQNVNNSVINQINSDWGSGWGDVEEIITPPLPTVGTTGNNRSTLTSNPVQQPPFFISKENETKKKVVKEDVWGEEPGEVVENNLTSNITSTRDDANRELLTSKTIKQVFVDGRGSGRGDSAVDVSPVNITRENTSTTYKTTNISKQHQNQYLQSTTMKQEIRKEVFVDNGWGLGWGDADESNPPNPRNVTIDTDIYKPVSQRTSYQPPLINKLETTKQVVDDSWGSGWGDETDDKRMSTSRFSSSTNKEQKRSPVNSDINKNKNNHRENSSSTSWGDSNTVSKSSYFSKQNNPRDRSRSSSTEAQQRTGTSWNNNNSQQTSAKSQFTARGSSSEVLSRSNSNRSSNQQEVSPRGNNLTSTSSTMEQNDTDKAKKKSDDSVSGNWGGGW